jgi:hypothetical protein
MAKIIDAPQLRNLAHFSPDAVVSWLKVLFKWLAKTT